MYAFIYRFKNKLWTITVHVTSDGSGFQLMFVSPLCHPFPLKAMTSCKREQRWPEAGWWRHVQFAMKFVTHDKKNRSIFSDVYLVHLMHPAHFQASPLPGHHWSPAVNFFRPTGHFGLGWRARFCCQHGQVAVHHRSPSAQTPGEGWMATPHALVWKSWFIMGDPYIPLVCICKLSAGKQILVNDKIQKRFIL